MGSKYALRLRVGIQKDLKAAIQFETIDQVSLYPSTNGVRCIEKFERHSRRVQMPSKHNPASPAPTIGTSGGFNSSLLQN